MFCRRWEKSVSILVIMDVALEVTTASPINRKKLCLNPCYNGCCSRGRKNLRHGKVNGTVSILVIMDVALEDKMINHNGIVCKESQSLL